MAEADSVLVSELFVSIQGESSHTGYPCAFVRLTGCHLRCTYCDSTHAFFGGRRMEVSKVVEEVQKLACPRVEVTGGEPLLQPGVYPLMEKLLTSGLKVLLETSGTVDLGRVPPAVHKVVDLKTPSSGVCDKNDFGVLAHLTSQDELKFVIGTRGDYEWSREQVRRLSLGARPFGTAFSTVFGSLSPTALAEWVLEDRLPVRTQLQLHKYLWDPNAKGR